MRSEPVSQVSAVEAYPSVYGGYVLLLWPNQIVTNVSTHSAPLGEMHIKNKFEKLNVQCPFFQSAVFNVQCSICSVHCTM